MGPVAPAWNSHGFIREYEGISLRDGIDPFVHPGGPAAVRFNLLNPFISRLRSLDIVHRRSGGPVLDLQLGHAGGRAEARLRRVLACLDRRTFPFEVWAGDPWGRWE